MIELVMTKLKGFNVYSEVPMDKLERKIKNSLSDSYDSLVMVGYARIDMKKAKNQDVTEKDYEDVLKVARLHTWKEAYAIGAVDMEDVNRLKLIKRL